MIQKGISAKTTTRLPLGNPLFEYAIGLEVLIIDGLGAAETELLFVKVRNSNKMSSLSSYSLGRLTKGKINKAIT